MIFEIKTDRIDFLFLINISKLLIFLLIKSKLLSIKRSLNVQSMENLNSKIYLQPRLNNKT